MKDETRRERLHDKIDDLNDTEVVVIDRFVDAVLTPVEFELADDSWLVIEPWAAAFLARLEHTTP